MPDALLLPISGDRISDNDNNPASGAKVHIYYETTLDQMTTYTADDLVTPHPWPVLADGNGLVPDIYVGTDDYKIIVRDSNDNLIYERDNRPGALDTSVFNVDTAPSVRIVTGKTSNFTAGGTTGTERDYVYNVNSTSGPVAATLISAVTVGNGFPVTIRHDGTANTVAVVAVSGQVIKSTNGNYVSITLKGRGEAVTLVSDGANWSLVSHAPPYMTGTTPFPTVVGRIATPPSNPTPGARYIISGAPEGTWATLAFTEDMIAEADGNGSWIGHAPQAGWFAYSVADDKYYAFDGSDWVVQSGMAAPQSSTQKAAIFQYTVSNGTGGGSATTDSWTTRAINTTVMNDIDGASLATNEITLAAGRYAIDWWMAVGAVVNVQTAIVATGTATPTISFGQTGVQYGIDDDGDFPSTRPALPGGSTILTVPATTKIVLQYYIDDLSAGTTNLGVPAASGTYDEVHAQIRIISLTSLQGPQGIQGVQGNDGLDAAYWYQFSSTTSGDPGTGKWRLDHATPSSATELAVSETDAAGASLAAVIATWDDSTSANRARVIITKEGATQNRVEVMITGAGTDQGTYWTFPITPIASAGTIANTNDCALNVAQTGDKGDKGDTGLPGSQGVTGSTTFDFDSDTSDADPGQGEFRLNHATPASATAIYIDNENKAVVDVTTWLDDFDTSGDASLRGILYIASTANPTGNFHIFNVIGSVVDGTGYRKLTVAHRSGNGALSGEYTIAFIPAGPAPVTSPAAFATVAEAEAFAPTVGPDFIRTWGYAAAGDGGGALYKNVGSSEPSHAFKFFITLADAVTVVWYEIAEEFVRPEMIGAPNNGVTDATAELQATLASGFNVRMRKRSNYLVSEGLILDTDGQVIKWNGATISSDSVAEHRLIDIQADDVEVHGPGTLDCAGLPALTQHFVGVDWEGFGIACRGSSGSEYSGLYIGGNLRIKNAPGAAIGIEYVDDWEIDGVYAFDCDEGNTYDGPGVYWINQVDRYTARDIRATNFNWKGWNNSNGTDFELSGVRLKNGKSDQAGIFLKGCSNFAGQNFVVRDGFGMKADRSSNFVLSNMAYALGGVGHSGIMTQGCDHFAIDNFTIRDYTATGIAHWSHPTSPAANNLLGTYTNFNIRGGSANSVAIQVTGSATEDAGRAVFDGGYIYNCQTGITVTSGTNFDHPDCVFADITIDTFATNGVTGCAQVMSLDGIHFRNAASASNCIRLFNGNSLPAKTCSIVNCDTDTLPTNVNFINGATTGSTGIKFDLLNIDNNSVHGGSRFIVLTLNNAADYVRALKMSNNNSFDAAGADPFRLSNASSSVNTQVMIVGNTALTAAGAKQDINFIENAASGKWNGVVENNLADITQKPNNV